MSPEPFDSRAKAPPAKRWEKGYGDENGGVDVTSGELNKFVELALSMLVDRYSWYIVFMQVEAAQPRKKRLHYLSHAGQNYWMLIGWDRGHFFLNQEGMITWCWLAEHACTKLVSRFKRSLKRNFRNASLLSLILTGSFHLNLKVEKQKDFPDQKRIDSQREISWIGDGWCWTKH